MSSNKERYIGQKGYSIPKNSISIEEQNKIRQELTVKPFVPPNSIQQPKSFQIFRESPKKLYVPRFYGINKYGLVDTKLSEGETVNLPFVGELRDYQTKIIQAFMNEKNKTGCGLLEVPCGRGKCLGYDTKILMYDYSIKPVQDIVDGDILIGDDLTPRMVYGSITGQGQMYTIIQSNGMTYRVNEEHILTLYNAYTNRITDITLMKYLSLSAFKKSHYKGIIITKDRNYIFSDISIVKEDNPIDHYFGFRVNKNQRFLLGDGTITHNTVMALNIVSLLKKKTLIIVHKEFLMTQWLERIQQFLPSARVGRIQGPIVDIEDKDIVLGMLQSLSMKDYPASLFKSFGMCIIDETHHIAAEVFCRSLFKIVTPYMLGLSATMTRKDGLTKVFKMFIGKVLYKETRNTDDDITVRKIEYKTNDEEFNTTLYNFKGQTHYALMIRKLCEYNHRSEFILTILKDMLAEMPDQQIMILAHNKSLLHYLFDAIEHRNIATVGYYIGGMKQKALKETETKQVVIATYAMAEEALDIKSLASLIMATPKTDVTQSVGRILRMKHPKPIVVDVVDSHAIFQRQWVKRRRFYMKCKYKITTNDNESYTTDFDKWEVIFEPGQKSRVYRKRIKKKDQTNSLRGKCFIKIDTSEL